MGNRLRVLFCRGAKVNSVVGDVAVADGVLCRLCRLFFFVLCPFPDVVHDIYPRLCLSLDRFSILVVLPSPASKNAKCGLWQIMGNSLP